MGGAHGGKEEGNKTFCVLPSTGIFGVGDELERQDLCEGRS